MDLLFKCNGLKWDFKKNTVRGQALNREFENAKFTMSRPDPKVYPKVY